MNPWDYQAATAGRAIKAPEGYYAFVPAPLPPELAYTPPLVRALSEADAALSELSGLGRVLPNPHLLIAPYLRREAVLSSRIEGTQASLADLLADEAGQAPQVSPDDVREVRNYVTALQFGIERLKSLPLSLRLVRELHAKLMDGVRGGQATPGEFRRSQNWIGPPGSTPTTAPYVPPPVAEMKLALGEWEKFLHRRDEMPDLIQCALMHEHFEAIHPFLDGNGRVGRLLITLFLTERERLAQPLLYLSEYIERNRAEYYDRLQRIRTHGDWTGWLLYFLAGVRWSALRAARQAGELMDLRETMRRKVADSPRALPLVDELFINPNINAGRVQKVLGVTAPTARAALGELEAAALIVETTGRNWGRQYLARQVLRAIESPSGDNSRHMIRRLRAGASGYSFKEWKGSFYPAKIRPDAMLAYYAERLPTVEINSSFYAVPKVEVLQKWAAAVPADFCFSIKAPGQITHKAQLRPEAAAETLALFCTNLSALGSKCGPLLFQLPPYLKKDVARLRDFLSLLPPGTRAAFEFRHDSWLCDETYSALEAAGAALCLSEREDHAPPPLVETVDWGYVRLRLEQYSEQDLQRWAERIAATRWRETFAYFMHEPTAPAYAAALMQAAA